MASGDTIYSFLDMLHFWSTTRIQQHPPSPTYQNFQATACWTPPSGRVHGHGLVDASKQWSTESASHLWRLVVGDMHFPHDKISPHSLLYPFHNTLTDYLMECWRNYPRSKNQPSLVFIISLFMWCGGARASRSCQSHKLDSCRTTKQYNV